MTCAMLSLVCAAAVAALASAAAREGGEITGRPALLARVSEATSDVELSAVMRSMVQRVGEDLKDLNCLALLGDRAHQPVFGRTFFKRLGLVPVFKVMAQDKEDLLSPNLRTLKALRQARKQGCRAYFLLFANGIQLARLLRFGDSQRVLDTRGRFVILFDRRLLSPDLHYLWRKIVNVVFVRRYGGPEAGRRSSWFELSTVPFPAAIGDVGDVLVTRRLDIWRRGAFRQNTDLFRDKTSDLQNQTLAVVTFQHVPAAYKINMTEFSGLEVQVMRALARAMNFAPRLYEAATADREQWGRRQLDGSMSGLLGEVISGRAELVLGDLHYTPHHLHLMDLSVPYHSECLTFLTPEATSDNSWQTLILPFKAEMWLAVGVALVGGGAFFFILARSGLAQRQSQNLKGSGVEKTALHLFAQSPGSSMLYTSGMLLGVSLPRMPTSWAVRVMTGWWWLFSILVVVAYRAALTAILANPAPKVTIDTLEQLGDSALAVGGWGEHQKDFFLTSLDEAGQKVGRKFEVTDDWEAGVERVAQGSFAFYENAHFLQYAAARRGMRVRMQRDTDSNGTESVDSGVSGASSPSIGNTSTGNSGNLSTGNVAGGNVSSGVGNTTETQSDASALEARKLHIMRDCVINMPISLGLQRNSPLKPRVDRFLRRVIEAGLVHKWLTDAMLATTPSAVTSRQEEESIKALMELRKMYGALVALGAGYLLSGLVLVAELSFYRGVVTRRSGFDLYDPLVG